MANQRRSGRSSGAPKRPMFWEGSNVNFSLATNTVSSSVIVSEALLENIPKPTVIRLRGRIAIFLTAVGAADTIVQMTFGIKVVNQAALAIGVTALEVPGTDVGSDWMWWDTITMHKALNTGVEDLQLGANKELSIDNKAMRKIDMNQALVMVVQNVQISGGAGTVAVVGSVRCLFKR